MTKDEPAFPLFVFVRRRAIEMETGLALAGILIVDIPKRRMGHREEQMIQKITDGLYAMVRSGRMGDDAVINGWPHGAKPANAVDVYDEARMAAWAERSVKIAIRIDPRDDAQPRPGCTSPHRAGSAGTACRMMRMRGEAPG
jgi:hypothetical protein